MRHHILIPLLLVPLLTLADARPASAQFDFGSWFQRATIIANQITQISHQVTQIRSMARQLTELEDQLDHMERAAKGEIDALLRPFSDLAADPVGLVRNGLGWRSDFTGPARNTVDAVRRFGTGGSFTDLWRAAHGTADRQRVRDYAALDAAAALAETIESAQGSFSGLTSNRNLSNTALQQAGVAAALSQGRINAATGQVCPTPPSASGWRTATRSTRTSPERCANTTSECWRATG